MFLSCLLLPVIVFNLAGWLLELALSAFSRGGIRTARLTCIIFRYCVGSGAEILVELACLT
jgi:hypothetical protein